MLEFHPDLVALTSLFLAAKVGECMGGFAGLQEEETIWVLLLLNVKELVEFPIAGGGMRLKCQDFDIIGPTCRIFHAGDAFFC